MTDTAPILLAEDDPAEAFRVKQAFESAGFVNPIYVLKGEPEVAEYFRTHGRTPDQLARKTPLLVFLQLRGPAGNGLEILESIRSRKGFNNVPVVVAGRWEDGPDLEAFLASGNNAYWVQPSSIEALVKSIRQLKLLIESIENRIDRDDSEIQSMSA